MVKAFKSLAPSQLLIFDKISGVQVTPAKPWVPPAQAAITKTNAYLLVLL